MRALPRTLTWVLSAALVAILIGERILGHVPAARLLFSAGGGALLFAVTLRQLWVWKSAQGGERLLSGIMLAGYFGVLVAVLAYFVSRNDTMRVLDLADATRTRVQGIIWVLVPIIMAAALLPTWMAEWSAGHLHGRGNKVESMRITEAASGGLSIALAAALLFVVSYIASEHDYKLDMSYFRTSRPGSATRNMWSSLGKDLRVLFFFPEVNEIRDEARSYFIDLAQGGVKIDEYDRLLSPKMAREHSVTKDGSIVIGLGDREETITLGVEVNKARLKLRTLDEDVQAALMKLSRSPRIAYWMGGHGELNDRGPYGRGTDGLGTANQVKQVLSRLNYQVKDFGLAQGSAQAVPDDAQMVLVFGPKTPLLDEELTVLESYLARGGAVLIALDPEGEATLGPLEETLGIRFDGTPLADDKLHLPRRMNNSDYRLIVTDQFSSHPSVTTLSRSGPGNPILLVNSGFLADSERGEGSPKRTYVVKSLSSTFADKNDNNTLDSDETRASYNLVATLEGPATDQGKKMRALIFADVELFSDAVLMSPPAALNRALVEDTIKWLGGEEKFQGETRSEKDVPIEHTRGEDRSWFYGAILGVPGLVLGGGLFGIWRRRRRLHKREAK